MNRTTTAKKLDQNKLKSKAPADGSRRYDKGIFPAYDKEYSRLASRSNILNKDKVRQDIKNAFSVGGLGECKSSLLQLVGNDDGKYKEGKAWYTALIPAAKNNLKEVYRDFKRWQEKQVSDGMALEPPKTWPSGMLDERLKGEARLDVRRKEKAILEDKIEQYKAEQGKLENDEPLLPDGPVGKGLDHDQRRNAQWLIDGQRVSYSTSGIPFIDEPESPYDQMPIATYRQMSKEWMKENRIRRIDLAKRRNEYKQEMTQNGKKDELPTMFSVSKFESMLKRNGDWPEAPEWPEGAKKITEIEDNKTVGSSNPS